MNDIKLLPTDDLINELLERFDHALFTGMQININSQGEHITVRKWKGNYATTAGLASQVIHRINNVAYEEGRDADGLP